MSETHLTKGQKFELNGFKAYHHPFSDAHCRHPCGGVSAFIHNSIEAYIENVETIHANHIVLTMKGNHRIFGSYIPPSESIYFSEECLWDIPFIFTPKDSDRIILGGGDLNSRIGNLANKGPILYRHNPDSEMNSNGKTLKQICNRYNVRPLNNASYNNNIFDGDFTFNKDERKSQVDICLANDSALNSVRAFNIHNIPNNFSDHAPISASLEFDINSSIPTSEIIRDILSNKGDDIGKRPRKLPTDINWQAYANTASQDLTNLKTEIDAMSHFTQDSFDTIVNNLSNIIRNSANVHQCEKAIGVKSELRY